MVKEGPLGERTEPGTQKRRQEARDSGQVSVSKDLEAAVLLLVGMIMLNLYGGYIFKRVYSGARALIRHLYLVDVKPATAIPMAQQVLTSLLLMMLPIFATFLFVGVAVIILESGGFHFTLKPLTEFSLSKFNPITGIQRLMFSIRSMMKFLLAMLKTVAIFVVAYMVLRDEMLSLLKLLYLPAEAAGVAAVGAKLWSVSYWLAVKISTLMLIIGLFDYAYQRWQYEEDLKMSKKEVEDELKMMEGDPKIKAKRRDIQRKLAMQRMMKRVPDADVVITNPTELSVAVKYTEGEPAPKVVAKGAGALAKRIREIAEENAIPIVERRPLAQALYRTVDIDQYVPEKFWEAVAEVLAYVYELDQRDKHAVGGD